MTMTAPIPLLNTAELSVVPRKFSAREEVNSMTTATAYDHNNTSASATRRLPSHGVDRAVSTLAVAMLTWSQARAARASLDHAEHSRRMTESNLEVEREQQALRLTQRLGL